MPAVAQRPSTVRAFKADKLKVEVYSDRARLGAAAAHDVASQMRKVIAEKGKVAMVFASAPSQDDFTSALALVTAGTQDGLMAVRRFLDAARGGLYMPPNAADAGDARYTDADIVIR